MAAADDGTEQSVASAYCVVYRLQGTEWVVAGQGWSQVHLYRDTSDGTYRIVGWTVSDNVVVVNANVTLQCKYKKKSADFHKFTSEDGTVYGFGFYKKEESLREADKFMDAVLDVIRRRPDGSRAPADTLAGPASIPPPANALQDVRRGTVMDRINAFQTGGAPPPATAAAAPAAPSPSQKMDSFSAAQRSLAAQAAAAATVAARGGAGPQSVASGASSTGSAAPAGPASGGARPPAASVVASSNYGSLRGKDAAAPAAAPAAAAAAAPAAPAAAHVAAPHSQGHAHARAHAHAQHAHTMSHPHAPVPAAAASAAQRPAPPPLEAPPPEAHTAPSEQGEMLYRSGKIPLGKLKSLPPKPARNLSLSGPLQVGDPFGVVHTQHVYYDKEKGRYVGLSPDWEKQMMRQFGLPYAKVDLVQLPGYARRIPQVLVQMRNFLATNGGLESEGIFRLAPDQEECAFVKKQLDEGKFEGCQDINCVSNLIKVWFRELPQRLLDGVSRDAIQACDDEAAAGKIVDSMSEPERSLLLWLLDLCVEVSAKAAVNKMSPQNLAIVIGPNLFTAGSENPMASLMFSQKVANFLHKAILYRAHAK